MNPVEIEEAVSQLAQEPFDRAGFPFQFLLAFGNPETTIRRLRAGSTNQSDIDGVLQRNNIHIAACAPGAVEQTLAALRESPKTATNKAKFILATDGEEFQAEDLTSGEAIACAYADFPDHFGFFLPLAGISTVEQIRESSFDIRATGRLNKLYVTLLQDNPEWATAERRPDMNHFMARLIFCFFAEDTDIFHPSYRFTATVEKMSAGGAENASDVIRELFRAMNTPIAKRKEEGISRWADGFPYVNGELFSGSIEVPRFSKIARTYLLRIGGLDWTKVNPDIFGSMIQAVADDEERGALGMHYTSVPNILKLLNPLFLDDLRAKLEDAGDNGRKLLNLRNRMAKIRVFDPACGSGNFLVIAYKEMRAIEAEINRRRSEPDRKTDIPLTNFRGIELRDFPAEVARLALIIAEYQCDVLYRGQKEALAEFLPLDSENWITRGNALRLDWLSICPPTGTGVKVRSDDLFQTPLDQPEIDFENSGGETYICGNPPYLGSRRQDDTHKDDIKRIAGGCEAKWKSLDYSSCWIFLAKQYAKMCPSSFAFVTTSSLCEGLHISILWKHILDNEHQIYFAQRAFHWKNLAKNNAGVSVVVVGVSNTRAAGPKYIFDGQDRKEASNISAYLIDGPNQFVSTLPRQLSGLHTMMMGAMPRDGGGLIFSACEMQAIVRQHPMARKWFRQYVGSEELIRGKIRYCLWLTDQDVSDALRVDEIKHRFERIGKGREESPLQSTKDFSNRPHRFVFLSGSSSKMTIAVGAVSSERRPYLPIDCRPPEVIFSNLAYAIFDGNLSEFSILSSKLHLAWAGAVCGKLRMDISYSNTLGWNTFPLTELTEQNRADLTRCAERILLTREAHFPATIADLYDPDAMPEDLRRAHEENDEVLERIYIGRRFRNDTERLEKLFELYTKMTAKGKAA